MDQAVATAVGVLFSISTLVLLALGLAIIFGMMGVLNLAQGEFLTLGAYTVLVATSHGLSIWAGILLAPFVVGSIGVILERSIIRFLYGRPLDTMLATWGLSLALVGVMTLVMGPTTEGIATPLGSFEVGRYGVSFYRLVVIAISAGAALAMEQWPVRSRGFMSGVLQGSWSIGFLLSSVLWGLFGDYIGWRGMLWIGVLPASWRSRASSRSSSIWPRSAQERRSPGWPAP